MRRGVYRRGQSPPCIPGIEITGTVSHAGAGVPTPEGASVVGFLETGAATRAMPLFARTACSLCRRIFPRAGARRSS
jgi:hypothetical protein